MRASFSSSRDRLHDGLDNKIEAGKVGQEMRPVG
jgi:hypothetical protein